MVKENKLYDLLGVSPSASDQEIKKGYRKMALKFHPDKPTGDTEKFKEISEAFDILSNPDKRQVYDDYGLEAARGNPPQGGGGMPGGGMPGGFNFSSSGGGGHPFSQADAFNMFNQFGGFEGMFGGGGGSSFGGSSFGGSSFGGGSPFGGGSSFGGGMPGGYQSGGMPSRQAEPEVVDLNVPVTLEELYNGGTKKMKINRKGVSGSQETEIITINIKPGWKEGTKLSYPGVGDYINGQRQTIRFTIVEKPHPVFKRDGNNLIATINLSFKDSLLGFSKEILTLKGKKIPITKYNPINPSTTDRYPDLGMPISKTPGKYGDLIIKYKVDYPIVLSASQKEAIQNNF